MAIGPNDQIPGEDQPLFGKDDMLYAPLPQLNIVFDALGLGKFLHYLGLLGRGDVLVGNKMV